MFTVLTILKDSNVQIATAFKTEKSANDIHDLIQEGIENAVNGKILKFSDDFGHKICIETIMLGGCLLTDVTKEHEAGIEKNIISVRANKRQQERIASDPVLNLATAVKNQFNQ